MHYYTGVGSRKTPKDIIDVMYNIAVKAAKSGHILRSGGAIGADLAFEYGCNKGNGNKEIYYANNATVEAMAIAQQFHPAWNRCSEYARKLHGRNAFQVLGLNLKTPSTCLVCWTPDGCINHSNRTINTGGTGTAISIANHYNIPVYNLQLGDHLNYWLRWLQM